MKELKEFKAAEEAANVADVEAAQYNAVLNDSVSTTESKFDYSFEEPANPDDKAGSDFEIKFSGNENSVKINGPTGSIVVNNNKMI